MILFVAVAVVLFLIIKMRINAFVALVVAATTVGVLSPNIANAEVMPKVAEAFGRVCGKIGIVIAFGGKAPTWLAIVFVAIFATFHGHAHGTEMPVIANPWLYSLGFVLGTALIHLSGVLIGFGSERVQRGDTLQRGLGGIIALDGFYMVVS